MDVSVSVVFPHDGVANCELWLAATAQHYNRILYPHTARLEKNGNSKLEVQFLLNAYCFCTIIKLKNCKSNHRKSGDRLNKKKKEKVMTKLV